MRERMDEAEGAREREKQERAEGIKGNS